VQKSTTNVWKRNVEVADIINNFLAAIQSNPQANISYQAPGGGLYGSGTVTPQGVANPTMGYSTPILGGAGSFNASVSSSGPVSKFTSSSDLFAAARLNLKF